MSDYDCSESYTILVFMGLVLASPFLIAFWLFVWPTLEAYGYLLGWTRP